MCARAVVFGWRGWGSSSGRAPSMLYLLKLAQAAVGGQATRFALKLRRSQVEEVARTRTWLRYRLPPQDFVIPGTRDDAAPEVQKASRIPSPKTASVLPSRRSSCAHSARS